MTNEPLRAKPHVQRRPSPAFGVLKLRDPLQAEDEWDAAARRLLPLASCRRSKFKLLGRGQEKLVVHMAVAQVSHYSGFLLTASWPCRICVVNNLSVWYQTRMPDNGGTR
jgi:hypothetical protein